MTKTRDISKILQGVTVDGNIVADQYIGSSVTVGTANITGTATMDTANPEFMRITGTDNTGYAQFSFGSYSSPSTTGTHMINTAAGLFQIKTGNPSQESAQKQLEIDTNGNMDVTGDLTMSGNDVLAVIAESLTTNGYVKLSNGLIIQWGRTFLTSSGGTITWPVPFTSACYTAVGNDTTNVNGSSNMVGTLSTTGWTGDVGATATYNWIAIGVQRYNVAWKLKDRICYAH